MEKEKRDFKALTFFLNKYEAVNVISKEARRLNAIEPIFRQFPSDKKVTVLALERSADGLVGKTIPVIVEEDKKKK
ncbi:MAG: DNA-directed RNA polymerase subunit omega [Candidatus Coatesbacteria bacterium]|nr:DNA-directed RNA polymerase subunit omega [Candidatus Coatesbacteria bacterium]